MNEEIQQMAQRLSDKHLVAADGQQQKLQVILGSLDDYDADDRAELLRDMHKAEANSDISLLSPIVNLMQESKDHQAFIFVLSWGGYHAYRNEDGTYALWRMLDMKAQAMHCVLYRTTFDHVPTLEEARNAEPVGLHAPITPMGMLGKPGYVFVGAAPLTEDDLVGYATYLRAHNYSDEEIQKIVQNVVGYSTENPSRAHLYEDPQHKGSVVMLAKH